MKTRNILLKILNFPISFKTHYYPFINRLIFKLKGVKYGKNFKAFNQIYLIGKGKITIGENFMFVSGDGINPIGSNVKGCIYTEPNATIQIGDNVGISCTTLRISNQLKIGDNVKIGANTLIIDTDSHQLNYELRRKNAKTTEEALFLKSQIRTAPITIEDDVWIGAKCIILKGVTIGARSIIGAGSVVSKDIPSDCIAAGNPCKVIKYLSKE